MKKKCRRMKKQEINKMKVIIVLIIIIIFICTIIGILNFKDIRVFVLSKFIKLEKIEIIAEQNTLEVGEKVELKVKYYPDNADFYDYTIESSNNDIINVENNNVIEGINKGNATVKVTCNGKEAKEDINVMIKAKEINLQEDEKNIRIGEKYQIVAKVIPEDASNTNLKYLSENEEIATVNELGEIEGIKEGETTIRIFNQSEEVENTIKITVLKNPVEKIEIDDSNVEIGKNERYILTATVTPNTATYKEVKWKSNNENILTIDENGIIKTKGIGKTSVVAITDNGDKQGECIFNIVNNPKDTYQLKDNLVKNLNIDSNNISENKELLRYLGVFPSDTTTKTVMILAIIVIGIILFTSIFVIRNSFNISLTEKTKELGMLASIDATSKQIKRSILFEGFIIGVIAMPIGIIVGLLAIYIVLAIVNNLLMDSNIVDNFDLKFVISPIAIAVSVIVSIIMIFVSSLKPAKRAAKITPIDAIRETNDVKVSSKKLKVSKLTKKLFGVSGEIGAKNFKRSKKKYRTTIFSITLSIILFISMNAVIENVFKASDYMYSENGEDNIVVNTPSSDEKSKYEYFDKILKLDNIEKYAIVKEFTVLVGEPYISEGYKKLINYEGEKDGITTKVETENEVNVSIVSVGDVQYKEYLKELGLSQEEAEGKGILYDQFWEKQEDKRIQYSVLNINSGDELEFEYLKENEENPGKVKIPIILKTDKTPMSMFKENNGKPVIIISDSLMKEYEDTLQAVNLRTTGIYIKSSDPYKLEQEIENIDSTNKNMIFNIEQSRKQNETMSLILSIFSYGFIIVISVIGITNIFNTITTNMALRSKEFAVLKSVGMTDKEFKKMINYESLLYGIKSILYGIPIGLILSYLIYKVMSESLQTEYHFPLIPVIISIVAVFIIIFITMRYASKKSQKINLIETIRSENI